MAEPMQIKSICPSRRAFLAGSAGVVLGFYLSPLGAARAGTPVKEGVPADAEGVQFAPNAFIRIAPDDTVSVVCKHTEMGQGPYTGLTTIVAEELDADMAQMRAVAAPADDEVYKNLDFGVMGTGGSTSIANSYEQLRQAGATVRAMLVAAAAREWGVQASEITVSKGRIAHAASGRESGFGALAEKATTITLEVKPRLKDPKEFTLIGTDIHRLDTLAKSNGTAIYTIDISLPNMLTALVVRPDVFGAKVAGVDDGETRKIPGVVDVKTIPQGVAVYAETMWAALKGRAALKVTWDLSSAETRSSDAIVAEYQEKAKAQGIEVTNQGDVDSAFASATATIEAEYVFPYLAHAPMEPLDGVLVKAEDGTVDFYSGAQFPTSDQAAVAKTLGLQPRQVRVQVQFAGGSFGRRAQNDSPYAEEAAEVFKASGGWRPLKHLWLREDDIRGGWSRPIYVHRLRGSVGRDGTISAWDQVVVGQSILDSKPDVDPTSVEGAVDLPYAIANRRLSLHTMDTGVPVLWFRSVGNTHTGFATETFIDELLTVAGKDQLEGRLDLLEKEDRRAGVLRRVGELAEWGGPVTEGRARGVAVHKSFDTYVAQIAEVSDDRAGLPRVHKVWCAVDCGVAINPNVIRAQMEGGIGYGLGAILFGEITLGENGRIQQSNFHDYRTIRINEMPEVEVAVVESTEKPTGVGEPGVPPIGPAVANAWRKLTGRSVRRLPLRAPLPHGSLL
jgi:isoquinoline 1-oxidoreductase beta subunit